MGALPLSGLEVDCPLTWPFFWFWHLPVLRFRHGIFILAWHLQLLLFHETPRRRLVETGESLVDCSLGAGIVHCSEGTFGLPDRTLFSKLLSPHLIVYLFGAFSSMASFFFQPRSASSFYRGHLLLLSCGQLLWRRGQILFENQLLLFFRGQLSLLSHGQHLFCQSHLLGRSQLRWQWWISGNICPCGKLAWKRKYVTV